MRRCRILVVEDEFIVRQALQYIIQMHPEKYEIIGEAQNGLEACKMLSEMVPDVIISDIVMPQMDGIEFTKHVQLNYPNIDVIILSSYDNFDYVKQSFQHGVFDYLLKPKLNPENMCALLDKICKKIGIVQGSVYSCENNFLQQCFSKDNITSSDIPKNKNMCTLAVNILNTAQKDAKRSNICAEIISEKTISFFTDIAVLTFMTDDGILLCQLICDEKERCITQRLIEKFAQDVSTVIPRVKIAYSDNACEPKEIIKNIYRTHNTAHYHYYVHGKHIIYRAKDIQPSKLNIYNEFESKRIFFEESFELLHVFISSLDYSCGFKQEDLIKQVEHIIFMAYNSISVNKYNESEPLYVEFMNEIARAQDIDELLFTIDRIFLKINKIRDYDITGNELMGNILGYINANYMNQITLQNAADEFHISYAYLSTYFHNNFGIKFSEHLNNIRIEKAKQMLKKPENSVQYVCESVGYLDQSYFSRVFKKHTGYSPSTYRR